jgi:hypothetical protein
VKTTSQSVVVGSFGEGNVIERTSNSGGGGGYREFHRIVWAELELRSKRLLGSQQEVIANRRKKINGG